MIKRLDKKSVELQILAKENNDYAFTRGTTHKIS